MRRYRNTKIVATLGPASSEPEVLRRLFEAGADVFRFNMSHGDQADHRARYAAVRKLERDSGRPIGIMLDLQGPKLRIGRFEGGAAALEAGQPFRLDLAEKMGDATRVQLPHQEVFAALGDGTELLLDDGRVRLRVDKATKNYAETTVLDFTIARSRRRESSRFACLGKDSGSKE